MELDKNKMDALHTLRNNLTDMEEEGKGKLDNEFYLLSWLKANNFNVAKTETAIRNSFKWRKENGISSKVDQFPKDLIANFPADIDGVSRTGRPICAITVKSWDLRKWLESGEKKQLLRFFSCWSVKLEERWLELNTKKTREDGKFSDAPFIHVLNCKDVSLGQFASPEVIGCFIHVLRTTASYFPPMIGDVFYINFTKMYYAVFKLVKPFMTFVPIHVFDCQEQKWKDALSIHVDPGQLTPKFGGTKQIE